MFVGRGCVRQGRPSCGPRSGGHINNYLCRSRGRGRGCSKTETGVAVLVPVGREDRVNGGQVVAPDAIPPTLFPLPRPSAVAHVRTTGVRLPCCGKGRWRKSPRRARRRTEDRDAEGKREPTHPIPHGGRISSGPVSTEFVHS